MVIKYIERGGGMGWGWGGVGVLGVTLGVGRGWGGGGGLVEGLLLRSRYSPDKWSCL